MSEVESKFFYHPILINQENQLDSDKVLDYDNQLKKSFFKSNERIFIFKKLPHVQ